MNLTGKSLLSIWILVTVMLLAAYALAAHLETGEVFFLILNFINALLVISAVLFRKKLALAYKRLVSAFERMIETARTAQIELVYDHEIKFGGFFLVTAALAGIYVVILSIWDTQSYSSLIREDGLVEYASAFFWILAAIVLFLTIIRPDRNDNSYKFHKLPYLLILLFFIVSAGEEISWGQRIFALQTPDLLKTINVQDELNLHNIGSISIFSNAFFLLTILFFLALPYVKAKNTSISNLIDYYVLPIPNRFAVGTFLISLSVWLLVGIRFGTLGFHPFSFYAENYYTQMDDEIFECLAAYSFLSFSVMNRLKSIEINTQQAYLK